MKRDEDELQPSDLFTDETIRRAEELSAGLSEPLSLDKRGEGMFYNGAFTDLASVAHREYRVTVADLGGQPWLTLISEDELPLTNEGLLVYNIPPREGRRYLGQIQKTRPGLRGADHSDRFFAIFDIVRDVRR